MADQNDSLEALNQERPPSNNSITPPSKRDVGPTNASNFVPKQYQTESNDNSLSRSERIAKEQAIIDSSIKQKSNKSTQDKIYISEQDIPKGKRSEYTFETAYSDGAGENTTIYTKTDNKLIDQVNKWRNEKQDHFNQSYKYAVAEEMFQDGNKEIPEKIGKLIKTDLVIQQEKTDTSEQAYFNYDGADKKQEDKLQKESLKEHEKLMSLIDKDLKMKDADKELNPNNTYEKLKSIPQTPNEKLISSNQQNNQIETIRSENARQENKSSENQHFTSQTEGIQQKASQVSPERKQSIQDHDKDVQGFANTKKESFEQNIDFSTDKKETLTPEKGDIKLRESVNQWRAEKQDHFDKSYQQAVSESFIKDGDKQIPEKIGNLKETKIQFAQAMYTGSLDPAGPDITAVEVDSLHNKLKSLERRESFMRNADIKLNPDNNYEKLKSIPQTPNENLLSANNSTVNNQPQHKPQPLNDLTSRLAAAQIASNLKQYQRFKSGDLAAAQIASNALSPDKQKENETHEAKIQANKEYKSQSYDDPRKLQKQINEKENDTIPRHTNKESTVELNRINSEKKQPLDNDFKKRYVLDNNGNYKWAFNQKNTAFQEKNNLIAIYSKSEQVPEDVVKLLASKGAERIQITGTKDLKDKIWMAAEDRGIEVMTLDSKFKWKEYQPSLETKQEYERTRNTVKKADSTKEISDQIRTDLHSENASKLGEKNPDLKKLLKYKEIFTTFAENNIHKETKEKNNAHELFINASLDPLINKIAKGQEIPNIKSSEKTRDLKKESVAER
jgi:hypothetical protein